MGLNLFSSEPALPKAEEKRGRKRLFDLESRLRRVCLAIDVVSFLSQRILRRSGRHSDGYIRSTLKIVLN